MSANTGTNSTPIRIPIAKPQITAAETEAVIAIMRTGQLAQGKKVEELEKMFYGLTGQHAIAVSNGTTALHTALFALGIKEGDEVITVPFTFAATANSIKMCNAKPVFVDISEDDYLIDVRQIEKKITKRTKAIIPVDLFGQCADFKAINEIAKRHNLVVVEDAAQSIGATQDGMYSGGLCDAATFSLYATKNVMCGEGGMVTAREEHTAKIAKQFRHHGQGERYEYEIMGYNYRMTDLAAAIAVEQMKRLEEITSVRQRNARILDGILRNVRGIIIPKVNKGNTHVYHQYAIRVTEEFGMSRDELKKALEEKGIGTGVHYPKPLHLHKAFSELGMKEGDLPVCEKISKEILSIPVHQQVSEEDARFIAETIRDLGR